MDINPTQESGLIERVISINRVAKVVKGGRRFHFSAIVVLGDGQGMMGVGKGKAQEVPEAIRKATEDARKNMRRVPLDGTTIPHEVVGHFGSGHVLLKPAPKGTGVIAGGPIRAIMEAAGVKDVVTKCLGSNNPHNVVAAVLKALDDLESREEVYQRRRIPMPQTA